MVYTFGDRLKPTAELLKHMPRHFHSGSRAIYLGTDKHGDIKVAVAGRKKLEAYHPKYWEKE